MSEFDDVQGRQGNTAHRAIIKKIDDSGDQQLVDLDGLHGEAPTEVMRVMPHGFASNPPADSEAVLLGLGTRDLPVMIGGESPKHRPRNLPIGAARLYDTADGFVYLDADGNLHAKVSKKATVEAAGEIIVKAPKVTIEATDIVSKGRWVHDGDLIQTGIHTDNNGVHA